MGLSVCQYQQGSHSTFWLMLLSAWFWRLQTGVCDLHCLILHLCTLCSWSPKISSAVRNIYKFTLLAYIPEQILCLPHCTYMFLCTPTVVYIQTPHYIYVKTTTTNFNSYLLSYIHICQQQLCPSNATCILHMPITLCADMRQLCSYIYIYILYIYILYIYIYIYIYIYLIWT